MQGQGGIWLAGAWAGYGFHEDGIKSAVDAITSMGALFVDGCCVQGVCTLFITALFTAVYLMPFVGFLTSQHMRR